MSLISEMVEDSLRKGIHARFKNNIPTEDEFDTYINATRLDLAEEGLILSDEMFNMVRNNLMSVIQIRMDRGVVITGNDDSHSNWVKPEEVENYPFWNRYERYLREEKGWSLETVNEIDRTSSEILNLIGNPKSENGFKRRGLILGDVQSGKTANFTAIINKAADSGYKVVIVLTGILENLRKQTQERLDAEFAGRKSNDFFENVNINHNYPGIGVGLIDYKPAIAAFTSVNNDFNKKTAEILGMDLNAINIPVLFVVKKNKRNLDYLSRWLNKSIQNETGKVELPLLLIDDESDNASVNTNSTDENPTAINRAIRNILNKFSRSSYIGITATPFANIFIDSESKDEMFGNDLFPKDFIYVTSAPSNYIGLQSIFDEESSTNNKLVYLDKEAAEEYFPFGHKKTLGIEDIPDDLKEAIRYFLLTNVIRDLRGDERKHRSMMIHVSRFTDVQERLGLLVKDWLKKNLIAINNYSLMDSEFRDKNQYLAALKRTWNKFKLEESSPDTWDEICLSGQLDQSTREIVVQTINQKSDDTLDYSKHIENGLRVIAVGGNSLSRGLTLEGLNVTYFYRKTLAYDTLLQMGRWFGYREGYEDLVKIWISEESADWFRRIYEAVDELKKDIEYMHLQNKTPADFGLRVRQDPDSLIVTARNKMRSAETLNIPVSISGKVVETARLIANSGILKQNNELVTDFVNSLIAENYPINNAKDVLVFNSVPGNKVANLLKNYKTHQTHLSYQGSALSDYIQNNLPDQKWDVGIVRNGSGQAIKLFNLDKKFGEIKAQKRTILHEDEILKVNGNRARIGAPGIMKSGLNEKQIEEAVSKYNVFQRSINPNWQKKTPKDNLSDRAYLNVERDPILLIHILESREETSNVRLNNPEYYLTLSLGFPGNGDYKTAQYVINRTYLENLKEEYNEDEE